MQKRRTWPTVVYSEFRQYDCTYTKFRASGVFSPSAPRHTYTLWCRHAYIHYETSVSHHAKYMRTSKTHVCMQSPTTSHTVLIHTKKKMRAYPVSKLRTQLENESATDCVPVCARLSRVSPAESLPSSFLDVRVAGGTRNGGMCGLLAGFPRSPV